FESSSYKIWLLTKGLILIILKTNFSSKKTLLLQKLFFSLAEILNKYE
ncbi:unnamed protein product, partial [Amoebophrya sp. A120]